MPIGDQFSGLDMKNLIGAPLSASADASIQLAQSTSDFINKVGFDQSGKVRTASFKFNKVEHDPDGNMTNQEMNVEVPMLSIVPIPNLQIEEVNVLFDMEVKQSEQSESANDYGGSFSGGGSIYGFSVSVSGSISAHSSNTRSSDNSAKYHVDVSAKNYGTPEGLSRVLDIMAANVAPALVSSTAVDQNGKPLVGDQKVKNEKLKELRAKQFQLDSAVSASEKYFNNKIMSLKKVGSNYQSKYSLILQTLINSANPPKPVDELRANLQKINENWNGFQAQAKDIVNLVTPNFDPAKNILTTVTKLLCVKDENTGELGDLVLTDADLLEQAYADAVKANKSLSNCVDAATKNQNDYNEELRK